MLHPLFKCFGSKWGATRAGKYPCPIYEVISEPFCGGAGYSLHYHDRDVVLFDSDHNVRDLWKWLIYEATEDLIRDIPVGVPAGTDIRDIGLSFGQALLLKHWQRTNNVGECWTISPWGDKPGQWTANTRARVAEESQAIKHWRFLSYAWPFTEDATHFVDPPYIGNYAYRQPPIDYSGLGKRCAAGGGQMIVCEGLGKDGSRPSWLPFRPIGESVTSRRKSSQSHHRMEYIWTKG